MINVKTNPHDFKIDANAPIESLLEQLEHDRQELCKFISFIDDGREKELAVVELNTVIRMKHWLKQVRDVDSKKM
jgi:hypothetical protein